MKVTAIIEDVNETFFKGLDNMTDKEKFDYLLNTGVTCPSMVSTRVGGGMFRDKVELNQLRRKEFSLSYKLESRKGYKLATFEITA